MRIRVEDQIREIKGIFHIRVWDGKPIRVGDNWVGFLKTEKIIENLMTTKGKQLVLNLLAKKTGVTGLEVIGIGTGTTTESAGDTTLETERTRENITFTSTISGGTTSMTYSAFFEPDDPGTTYDITEVGLFGNGATLTADSGDLFARKTFTAVEKETGIDTLTVDYSLAF